MKKENNKLAQFKQWVLSVVMWRYFLILFVAIPTPVLIMIDPQGTTTLSITWITFGSIALVVQHLNLKKMTIRVLKIIASLFFLLGMIPMGLVAILVYIYNGNGLQVMLWYDKLDTLNK